MTSDTDERILQQKALIFDVLREMEQLQQQLGQLNATRQQLVAALEQLEAEAATPPGDAEPDPRQE